LAALGREDAWIVAADYPFLRAMRLASRRFLFVSDDGADRLAAFRGIVSRLRSGEAVLVFPAGGLELDPALSRVAALASLATWSRSIELLARLTRETLVVPAAVRGVVSRSAFDHPLAKRRAVLKERQRMATLLQVALPVLQRFVCDVSRAYVRLAIVALVLSWIPDIALLFINEPGATVPAVGSLMVMHAVAAGIVVTLLVRIAGPRRPTAGA